MPSFYTCYIKQSNKVCPVPPPAVGWESKLLLPFQISFNYHCFEELGKKTYHLELIGFHRAWLRYFRNYFN